MALAAACVLASAYTVLPLVAAATTIELSIVSPTGGSKDKPTLGTSVDIQVSCALVVGHHSGGAPCPAPDDLWVRVDRLDGVTDTTPYWRVVDEAASFTNPTRFPFWLKPSWGPTPMYFGGAVDNRPIPIMARGFSAQYNGTQLTGNSTIQTIYYDVSYENAQFSLEVEDLAPGSVRLSVKALNESLPAPDHVRFDRYVLVPDATTTTSTTAEAPVDYATPQQTPPTFVASFSYHQESESGSIVLALQQPGIVFYGATPSYQGRAAQSTAGGEYGATASAHPIALVLAGPDGTVNATLPTGFQGTVHHMSQMTTPHQFCLLTRDVTLFPGGKWFVPLCRPDPHNEIPTQPGFVSVVTPEWVDVLPSNNQSCPLCNPAYSATLISSTTLGPGTLRRTFASASATHPRWSTYNNHVPLYIYFDSAHAGTTAAVSLLIHSNATDAATTPLRAWQNVTARTVALPSSSAPTRLVTSVTWTDSSLLLDGPAAQSHGGLSFLDLYARLGFNTVPLVSSQGRQSRSPWMYPGNRTGAAWAGLGFGPEVSGIGPTAFTGATAKPPNASRLPPTVPPSRVSEEMQKWQRAYEFFNATKYVDVGYDGAFFQEQVDAWCALVGQAKPQWVFMDDESYGEGWVTWLGYVQASGNAQARRLAGESDEALAWRMVRETYDAWMACVTSAGAGDSAATQVGWYGTPWPDLLFSGSGISGQPSEYGPQHYLPQFAASVRGARLRQYPMAGGRPRHLLPWLTACTYGQMTAQDTLASTLHAFGGGATGFSFFIDTCFDDPGKLLSLSTAVAYATPFEDHFLDGEPLGPLNVTAGDNVRAWSGMGLRDASSYWVVLTPNVAAAAMNVTLLTAAQAPSQPYYACNLATGVASGALGTGPALQVAVGGDATANGATAVLHVAPGATGSACLRVGVAAAP